LSDQVFWEQLGLRPGAGREQIRRAYRRLARRHHPDTHPEGEKALQELKMIALNEAYAHLMRRGSDGPPGDSAGPRRPPPRSAPPRAGSAPPKAGFAPPRAGSAPPKAGFAPPRAGSAPPKAGFALALHRDPAYVTYKQGFVHYSRALQGIEALYRSARSGRRVVRSLRRPAGAHFRPRDDAYERFAAGLAELRQAHGYFSRVIEDFEGSVWRRDAEVKLGRIERFTRLYRRILGNLGLAGEPPDV
jgi:curved DNA-binding protein CbpA